LASPTSIPRAAISTATTSAWWRGAGQQAQAVVLSTKTEARDKAGSLAHLDTSLSELKTDYVDIWYLHGKSNPADIHDDMIEALQLARQQGKAGLSASARTATSRH